MFYIVIFALSGFANACCDNPAVECPALANQFMAQHSLTNETAVLSVCTGLNFTDCHNSTMCEPLAEQICYGAATKSIEQDTVQAFCNATQRCSNTTLCFFPEGQKCYLQYQSLHMNGYDMENVTTFDSAGYQAVCSSGYPCFSRQMTLEEYGYFCTKVGDEWCAPKGLLANQVRKGFENMEQTAILAKYKDDPIFCNPCMEAYKTSLNETDAALFGLLCPNTPPPTTTTSSPTASPTTSSSTSLKLSGVLSIFYAIRMLLQ